MFESRFSAGATENLSVWGKPHARTAAWSYDLEGHMKKCVERYCQLANKKTEQLYKVSSLCLDDHLFQKDELESVGDLSNICSQIVLKCLYLARTGRPDILWSVKKLARSATKWTRACAKRLARLISYIHHTSDNRRNCHVGNTAQHCRLGLFPDSDFAGDLEDLNQTRDESYVSLEVEHLFLVLDVPETNVSVQQFYRFRIISLDAGLRMDRILALDLWDVVIGRVIPQQETVRDITNPDPKQKGNRDEEQLSHVDYVTTNANSFQGQSQLYIFSDNEAVIKMIIRCTRPTMWHVWLVVRQNQFGPQDPNQICWHQKPTRKHVNQRKPHTWPVGPSLSFVEYHELLDVFFQPFSFQQKAECHVQGSSGKYSERSVGSVETETNEFGVKEPPGGEERSSARFERSKQLGNQRIGSELCFIPWQETDAKHQPKPNNVFSREATRRHSIYQHQEMEAERRIFKLSPRQETGARWGYLQISDHRYLEKVFKNLRKKLNLAGDAPVIGIEASKTNVLIWGLFMSTTVEAAIHLGPN